MFYHYPIVWWVMAYFSCKFFFWYNFYFYGLVQWMTSNSLLSWWYVVLTRPVFDLIIMMLWCRNAKQKTHMTKTFNFCESATVKCNYIITILPISNLKRLSCAVNNLGQNKYFELNSIKSVHLTLKYLPNWKKMWSHIDWES